MSENKAKPESGMNRGEVSEVIKFFLDNQELKVLAIKGKWGVGKTHLVQNFLLEQQKKCYASVFGLSSIAQLKSQLLSNLNKIDNIDKQVNTSLTPTPIDTYARNRFIRWIGSALKFKTRNSDRIDRIPNLGNIKLESQLAGWIPSLPVAGAVISIAGDLALNLIFNTIKNFIVCIDDLERKSKLQLDELLGFVEYLVQELECRVILIYNEDQLDEESKKYLQEYREKVIDIEVALKPTVEENLDFGFDINDQDREVVQEVLRLSHTNNIRVIRKIKFILNKFRPSMLDWQSSLRNQVIKNIIIISLAKLDSELDINIDTVVSFINYSIYRSLNENSESYKNQMDLINTLIKFGYSPLEVDKEIIQFVDTSLFSSKNFHEKGKALNQKEKEKQVIEKFHTIWEPYYSSFGSCEQEIYTEIFKFLENHHCDLSLKDFDRLENLAAAVRADISEYKKLFIKNMIDNVETSLLKALRNYVVEFPDLSAELEQKIVVTDEKQNITQVLSRILERQGWSPEEIDFLNSCTVDDYYTWLQEDHPDLIKMIRPYIDIGNIVAFQRLRKAIVRLANESALNAMRAKFLYNINADESVDTEDDIGKS
ncbi:MAG: KAP family NTPase [Aphanothece sp. CMT-3BRIN-NPC111]|nr:KAP family NTPase [Aphanothece sp. CMT-3BRIN-NPC111]